MAVTSGAPSSSATASAIAPEPVPTSSTAAGSSSSASSTSSSVSGPRDQHPPVDRELDPPEPLAAEDVGDRLAPDPAPDHGAEGARVDGRDPRFGGGGEAGAGRRRSPRASSSSASSRGESTPARQASAARQRLAYDRRQPPHRTRARRRRAASSCGLRSPSGLTAPGSGGLLLEPRALLLGRERGRELAQVAAEDLVEVVGGELDPVVGDPALGEVVGADLLRALAGADLRAAVGGDLGPLLLERPLVEPRAQHLHRLLPVLQLRLLVLHRDHDPGRLVGDPDRRVGRVDRLPARPGGAIDVDLQVVRGDLDLDLLGLGQHRDGRGRRVDAALRLGLRDPLDPVGAALELEHRVGALAADLERDLLEAADLGRRLREHLGGEAALLGVAGEHLEQVAREQRGLVAAGAGADLDDHVLVVVGVALDHREAQLLLEPAQSLGSLVDDRAQLRVVAVLGEQLAGALEVAVQATPSGRQLAAPARARGTRGRPRRSARGPTITSGSDIWRWSSAKRSSTCSTSFSITPLRLPAPR